MYLITDRWFPLQHGKQLLGNQQHQISERLEAVQGVDNHPDYSQTFVKRSIAVTKSSIIFCYL